jgi:hypothetical protein
MMWFLHILFNPRLNKIHGLELTTRDILSATRDFLPATRDFLPATISQTPPGRIDRKLKYISMCGHKSVLLVLTRQILKSQRDAL